MKLRVLLLLNIILSSGSLPYDPNQTNEDTIGKPSNQTQKLLRCRVYSCDGENGNTTQDCSRSVCRRCHCDSDCEKYGDCCDLNRTIDVKDTGSFECVASKNGSHYFEGKYNSYYMKTTCPVGVIVDILASAQTMLKDVSPVTSLTTNVTYINSDVSTCNRDNIYVKWEKKRMCQNLGNKEDPQSEEDCFFLIHSPGDLPVRPCEEVSFSNLEYIDTCPSSDQLIKVVEAETKCQSQPYHPVVADGYVFKNLHCYLCNRPTAFNRQSCNQIPDVQQGTNDINSLVRVRNYKPVCKKSQWYDRLKNVCRYIICRQGYELNDEECVMTAVSLPNIQFHLNADFWLSGNYTPDPQLQNWEFVKAMVVKNVPEVLTVYNVSDYVLTVYNIAQMDGDNESIFPSFQMRSVFRTRQNCCRSEFETLLLGLLEEPWVFTYNGSSYGFDVCDGHFSIYSPTDRHTIKSISPGIIPEETDTYRSRKENVYLPPIYPQCSFVFLFDNDFEWNADRSITLHYADIKIEAENFTKNNEIQLVICVDTLKQIYNNYHSFNPVEQALFIISVILSILSLICLTLTFITYYTFPSLLTLPTKNTMCLVIFLFVAQFLLQFGDLASGDETTCKVIGVLLHYFWLSVIFWMNVCSYHMFHVFVIDAAKPVSVQSQHSRLLRYFLYANGSSLIIVVITIGANLGVSSGEEIGYGNGTCYLSTELLIGVSFVLPLGIILLMNITFFGISVWTMAKINKMSATIGQDKSQVHIYFKLSTLTGIFWILSILAENLDLKFLDFISVILNASQGVFIFISYMANRRILQLWKGKFSEHKSILSSQTTDSTMSSRM